MTAIKHALRIGTRGSASIRRRAQLLHVRPDLTILDIRGNVATRLRKLGEGQYDAIVLAEAGLRRLELTDRITEVLSESVMMPAVGQGALGTAALGQQVAQDLLDQGAEELISTAGAN